MEPLTHSEALLAAIRAVPAGLSLQELLGRFDAAQANQVCDTLGAALRAGDVVMTYRPEDEKEDKLAFSITPDEPVSAGAQVSKALDAMVAHLAGLTDGRGDFDPIAPPVSLFEKLAQSYDVPTAEAAMRLGFAEKLLYPIARASNRYVTVTLAATSAYTVVAYDPREEQAHLFHVRAGSDGVAMRKLAAAAPDLKRLAIGPGRIMLEAGTDQAPLTPQRL